MLAQIVGLIVDIGLGALAYKAARSAASVNAAQEQRITNLEARVTVLETKVK